MNSQVPYVRLQVKINNIMQGSWQEFGKKRVHADMNVGKDPGIEFEVNFVVTRSFVLYHL